MTTGLSRPWDSFDGYLFDIDGTLLNCRDAVHYFAFCDALTAIAGRPLNLDGVVTHGNVDEGILRDAFARGKVPESAWHTRLDDIRNRIGDQVEQHHGEFQIDVLPAVGVLLAHLKTRGALLSTATGNLQRVGKAKLSSCGLLRYFDMGGWSDGCADRTEVFRRAAATMRLRLGQDSSLCVVGDTPADVHAAHACGLEAIAVATGIYSQEDLTGAAPELCVASLQQLLPAPEATPAADQPHNPAYQS